jgi:hypothetical protein
MAELPRIPETSSSKERIPANFVTEFWAVVEDCLVNFHDFSRNEAALKVTSLWRRLADINPVRSLDTEYKESSQTFDDMIYHSEPWYVACNLAEKDISLAQHRDAYDQILRQNHLLT